MKRRSKSVATVLLAFVMLLVGMYSVFGKDGRAASALTAEGNRSIYYYYDYYPAVSYDVLKAVYDNTPINYDRITEEDISDPIRREDILHNAYQSSIMIFDIKTFMPESEWLIELFEEIKNRSDNEIALVSPCELSQYSDTSFMEYVDLFINDEACMRLYNFIKMSFIDPIFEQDREPTNTLYLIDYPMLGYGDFYGMGVEELCARSPFLRLLLQLLAEYIPLETDGKSYSDIMHELAEEYGIRIFVMLPTKSEFADIINWRDPDYLYDEVLTFAKENSMRLCAYGFIRFSDGFYRAMEYMRNHTDYFPIYAFVVDDYLADPSGLDVITNVVLEAYSSEIYGEEDKNLFPDPAADALMEWLAELLKDEYPIDPQNL